MLCALGGEGGGEEGGGRGRADTPPAGTHATLHTPLAVVSSRTRFPLLRSKSEDLFRSCAQSAEAAPVERKWDTNTHRTPPLSPPPSKSKRICSASQPRLLPEAPSQAALPSSLMPFALGPFASALSCSLRRHCVCGGGGSSCQCRRRSSCCTCAALRLHPALRLHSDSDRCSDCTATGSALSAPFKFPATCVVGCGQAVVGFFTVGNKHDLKKMCVFVTRCHPDGVTIPA